MSWCFSDECLAEYQESWIEHTNQIRAMPGDGIRLLHDALWWNRTKPALEVFLL